MRTSTPADPAAGAANDDPVPGLVAFTAVLRNAGLAVTTDRVAAFLTAVDSLDVTSQLQTYWAGRLTLCSDPDDLPRYDRAFADWFTPPGGGGTRIRDERPPPPPKLAALTPPDGSADGDDEEPGSQLRARASGSEVLRNRDVAELSPVEREHLRRGQRRRVPAAQRRDRALPAAAGLRRAEAALAARVLLRRDHHRDRDGRAGRRLGPAGHLDDRCP